MSIKKTLMLAGMALAAVAFMLPASASAATTSATILHEGKTITTSQEFTFTGKTKYEALGSGIECEVKATITVKEDINEITKYEIVTPSCVFFGSPYKNCIFNAANGDKITNLPWTLDVFTNGVGIEEATLTNGTSGLEPVIDMHLANAAGKVCPFTTTNFTLKHDLTATPPRGITWDINTVGGFIDSITCTGTITVDTTPSGAHTPVTQTGLGVIGTLTIEAAKTKTYTVS